MKRLPMSWFSLLLVCPLAGGAALIAQRSVPPAARSLQWGYGGGPQQNRYSALKQINRTNVKHLAVAWTYDTGEAGAMQTQPLVAGGVLYGYTPTHKTFAVNAGTGAELWVFDSGIRGSGTDQAAACHQQHRDRREDREPPCPTRTTTIHHANPLSEPVRAIR